MSASSAASSNLRTARLKSRFPTSCCRITASNPAFLNMSAMEAASLDGLGSLAAFWYAELPTTKATRFSALAAKLVANNNTTLRNSADIHRLIGQAPAQTMPMQPLEVAPPLFAQILLLFQAKNLADIEKAYCDGNHQAAYRSLGGPKRP